MVDELNYKLLWDKIKFGEQTIRLKKVDDFSYSFFSCLDIKGTNVSSEIKMSNSYIPEKINYLIRSVNFERRNELTIKERKLSLNDGEKELWFKGNIYDNLQVLFFLPLLLNAAKIDADSIFSLYIIMQDLNILTLNFATAKHSSLIGYESLCPVKYYSEYDSNECLLNYYLNMNDKMEIIRT